MSNSMFRIIATSAIHSASNTREEPSPIAVKLEPSSTDLQNHYDVTLEEPAAPTKDLTDTQRKTAG